MPCLHYYIDFTVFLLSLSSTIQSLQSHNITSTLIKPTKIIAICNITIPTRQLLQFSEPPNGLNIIKNYKPQKFIHSMDTKLLTIRTLVSSLSSSSDQTRLATISHHKPSLFSIENPHREEPFNRSRISNLACGFGREQKP